MRSGRGDEPEGFADFVEARGSSLHRTALLLTHHDASAQDLVQTALVKAWQHWSAIDQPEAYVRTIIVREFAGGLRRRCIGEVPTETLPETSEEVDHAARVATRGDLMAALATLPAKQRAVLVLRYYHDYTERQTAEALGIGVGTVKSHTARALAALRIREELSTEVEGGRS